MALDAGIRRALKQTRPFTTDAEALLVSLLLTADRLKRRLASVIEPQGITVQQFNVLRILRGAGAEGMPTLEVAARMVEQTPGITRLLDRLETKGLVRRQRCPVDRRQHLCRVTPAGLELLAQLDGPTEAVAGETLRNVPATQRATIMRALDAIRDSGDA